MCFIESYLFEWVRDKVNGDVKRIEDAIRTIGKVEG